MNYEPYVIHFVQKVIPDVHICLHDFLSYYTRFFSTTTPVYRIIRNTCLQTSHHDHNCTCHQIAHYDIHCRVLHEYARRTSMKQIVLQKSLDKHGDSDNDTVSSAASSSPPKHEDLHDSHDPYDL